MKDRNKSKLWIKIVLSAFIIIILVVGVTFSYTYYQFSKVNTTVISKSDVDLGIMIEAPLKIDKNSRIKLEVPMQKEEVNEIINIALFGIDRRGVNEPSRSDSIMILSIDKKHKKIKMSSIMRDTYVEIKNHGDTKINHAYAYGGAQLAIRTINENFNLDIRDYVMVDFFKLEKIIDTIGGVTIQVNQDEIELLNSYMIEVANIEKRVVCEVTKSGLQTLNGLQAVAYSRIRYTVGGDFRRTERQRIVLSAMITKIQSLGITEFPSVVSKILPFTETSMKSMDIIKLGTKVLTSNITTLEQARFPLDGYCKGKIMDEVWYLIADMDATADQLHNFIYEDIKPVPKASQF
ncbi:LCP family protein [Clostridium sp. FP1]|uniref:LCP family protein n=1 Tax=Clostridium sp. FP1 TaxID=2724076 RepID=UPI0013E917B6|nr:LCP family protein [Clostridium sp. FP1]MBZ9636900.1 LCP family protein [Clostridium sp. FP1]